MFTEAVFMKWSPQFDGYSSMGSIPPLVLLVTVITEWLPGRMCNVGFSIPLGAMKQKS
jgi:hypothetical protein